MVSEKMRVWLAGPNGKVRTLANLRHFHIPPAEGISLTPRLICIPGMEPSIASAPSGEGLADRRSSGTLVTGASCLLGCPPVVYTELCAPLPLLHPSGRMLAVQIGCKLSGQRV